MADQFTVVDRGNKGLGVTPETTDHGTKSEFMEFTKFLSQFYSRSLLNLKNLLEK